METVESTYEIPRWKLYSLEVISAITGICASLQLDLYYHINEYISIGIGVVIAFVQMGFFITMWNHYRRKEQ